MYCTQCGHKHESSFLFCTHCGYKNNISETDIQEEGNNIYYDDVSYQGNTIGTYFNKIKFYLIIALGIFFLLSLTKAVRVNGEGGVGGTVKLDGASGEFKFTGMQLLSDDLPKFSMVEVNNGKENRENILNNAKLKLEVSRISDDFNFQKLLRTPLHFRISYYFLLGSILLLAYSLFFAKKDNAKQLKSLAVIIGFASICSLIWCFNEFEIYFEKLKDIFIQAGGSTRGLVVDIHTHFAFSIWMMFLILLAFFIEYVVENLKPSVQQINTAIDL
jgi:hypothetical protein